ncbi:MAG TPA: hypothetical protein VN985_10705 [Candidatus Eisenbacteria bacterium]|nr:hypothetical protein [Candidatus Eisenbacteria bacterium]
MAAEERLSELIVFAMRGNGPMTAREIARAIQRRVNLKADARSVRRVLADVSRFRKSRRNFFQRGSRWELVEVGPVDSPGAAEARVPARPYPPTLSGAAAADLLFGEDEPPANAIGRPSTT